MTNPLQLGTQTTELLNFSKELTRGLEFRLREYGVKIQGHCETCSCNTIRLCRIAPKGMWAFQLSINGVRRDIAFNTGDDDLRHPTEEEWDKIVEAIVHPPLILTASP